MHTNTNGSFKAGLFFLQGWGLIDLPLRASNEGLLRPRVARARKIIRLHPFVCFGSKERVGALFLVAVVWQEVPALSG